jgi:hypothetical protein
LREIINQNKAQQGGIMENKNLNVLGYAQQGNRNQQVHFFSTF